MNEKCGIFGLISKQNTIPILFNGLKKLQHRGQDGCGIGFVNNNNNLEIIKKMGLVTNLKHEIENISSFMSIGHNRYATSSKKQCYKEVQPLSSNDFLLVHNGNIPFCKNIYDTAYLRNFIESYDTVEDGLINLVNTISGVYNLLVLTKDCIYVVKDRYGFRPLCITQTPDSLCVMSENVAYLESNVLREVKPGEIIKIKDYNSFSTIYQFETSVKKFCIFENIYFMHPDSIREENTIKDFRINLGSLLARQETILFNENYTVVGVPRSGIFAAKSYAKTMNLKYEQFILKDKNVNRSFIEPTQEKRNQVLRKKFIFENVPKKIIVVDDTIVRGNTMKKLVQLLRDEGAKEIHVRIPAPPVISECFYGVDIATKHELLSFNKTLEQMKKYLNVESLRFIENIDNYYSENNYCMSCFTNNHNKKLLEW